MTDFHLDTSGIIHMNDPLPMSYALSWHDLSPFAQGYVEALFASLVQPGLKGAALQNGSPGSWLQVHFRDLDPSALALIVKDCEEYQRTHEHLLALSKHPDPRRAGRIYWNARNQPTSNIYSPLRVFLSDEGKVCLREAS